MRVKQAKYIQHKRKLRKAMKTFGSIPLDCSRDQPGAIPPGARMCAQKGCSSWDTEKKNPKRPGAGSGQLSSGQMACLESASSPRAHTSLQHRHQGLATHLCSVPLCHSSLEDSGSLWRDYPIHLQMSLIERGRRWYFIQLTAIL